MIHDLKEESSAYARGVEDGKKEMFDLLRNSKVIGVYPDGRVLTRGQLLTPLIPMDNVKVVLADKPDLRLVDDEQDGQQHEKETEINYASTAYGKAILS